MGSRRVLTVFLFLCFLVPAQSSFGRRGDAYIEGVRLSRGERGNLVLDFHVESALDERILDTLDSGLPVRFTYWIQVVHPHNFGKDDLVVDLRLVRVLEKDNLKDRYRLTFEEDGEQRDLGGLASAVEAMSRVEGVSLLPLDALAQDHPLVLKIKAQLQKFRLPFRLHYLFAFVSYLDVETDWYTLDLPTDVKALP